MEEDLTTLDEQYIEYVQQQLNNLKETERLIEEGHVLPYRVNRALAEYNRIHAMLIIEYQRVKTINNRLKKRHKMWWDEKFIEARDKLNSDRTSSKYASKGEIESQARVDNKVEHLEWEDKLDIAEAKTRLLIRLLDAWSRNERILTQLSNNMRSEMRALYVEEGTSHQGGVRRTVKRSLPSNSENKN